MGLYGRELFLCAGEQVIGAKMKFCVIEKLRLVAIASFLLVSILGTPKGRAQAPAGPLPQTASQDGSTAPPPKAPPPDVPRTKVLAGTWRLNLDESDDPGKKLQQARGSDSGGQGGGRRGGGGMGGGWPGGGGMGGRGGMGGGGRGMGGGESDSDRQKMQLFLQPANQLTVVQKEPEIDVTDDDDRKFTFYTDSRKVEKSKDSSHQDFDAKWEQYRLVAEGKDPRGDKYERSYEVLEGNRQLRETILLKVGRNNTEVSIHYVYDLISPPAKTQVPPSS
jgi:hypothetical protein